MRPFSESDKNFDPNRLDPASKRTFDAAQSVDDPKWEMDPRLDLVVKEGRGLRAGYKIEVHFGPGRTDRRKYKALILLMESGKHFHGGGDGQMYMCLDHRPYEATNTTPPSVLPALRAKMKKQAFKISGCGSPIPSSQVQLGLARCPACQRIINAEHLMGQLPFYGTTQDLAELVEILFLSLRHNADIYCKYDRKDIRFAVCEKAKGLEEARQLRGLFIYPLKNIIKEVSAGATLRSRFEAFFRA